MPRDLEIPTEALEEILTWLSSDRETAANMYLQLRHDLEHLFVRRGCTQPEELTDEVFDRVATKVNEVRPTFEGDPRHYFQAVANNVAKEELKERKRRVSLDDVDPVQQIIDETDEGIEGMEECLHDCLQELSAEKRQLILAYYAKEKQAKIDCRNELAQQLGTSVGNLRVRLHRMRGSLAACVNRCLANKAQRR